MFADCVSRPVSIPGPPRTGVSLNAVNLTFTAFHRFFPSAFALGKANPTSVWKRRFDRVFVPEAHINSLRFQQVCALWMIDCLPFSTLTGRPNPLILATNATAASCWRADT